ncbi:MAG: HIT family protein [Planctomycetia bacterium]|nr:HIT family protein [Planctomycetia bacterium]
MCTMCSSLAKRDGCFIAEWPYHVWRLAEDQTWPGWSILIFKKHVTELFELSPAERAMAIEEVAEASRLLKVAFNATKMNVELLGNQEPHIHWHIVPRRNDDPAWNRPIWSFAHAPVRLAPREHDAVVARIRRKLPPAPPSA